MKGSASGIILMLTLVCILITPFNLLSAKANASLHSEFASDVDWWPMFHHDAARTGYSASTVPKTNQTIWNRPIDGPSIGSALLAVANGIVYVSAGPLYAFNATTGAEIWKNTLHTFYSCPAIADGVVYASSRVDKWNYTEGTAYALNASTGTVVLTYNALNASGSPIVANGVVYFGSIDHRIYALNATTNAQIWTYYTKGEWRLSAGGYIYDWVGNPTLANDIVYAGSADQRVYALNATTGTQIWNYTTCGAVYNVAVAGGVAFAGSEDHKIYALNATTGRLLWNYTTLAAVFSCPVIVYGLVYLGGLDSRIYALSAATGKLKWSYQASYSVDDLAVAGNLVFAYSEMGTFYALNATTGNVEWSFYKYGSALSSCSPAVANGTVYNAFGDGGLYAFKAQSTAGTPPKPGMSLVPVIAVVIVVAVVSTFSAIVVMRHTRKSRQRTAF